MYTTGSHFFNVSSRRICASSSLPALTRQNTSTVVSLKREARMCAPRKPDAPVSRTRWGGRIDIDVRNREYLSGFALWERRDGGEREINGMRRGSGIDPLGEDGSELEIKCFLTDSMR